MHSSAAPVPLDRPATLNGSHAPKSGHRWLTLREEIPTWLYRMLALLSFGVVLTGWAWLSGQEWINPVFVPTPVKVLETGRELFTDENLWLDIKMSLLRVSGGFLLSAALALPLGVWLGSFKAVESFVQPLTEFVRYIPVPALIPLLMLCFGIGEMAKVMLIFIGTFFQLLLMVADAIRRVPQEFVQLSYTLGARRGEIMRLVLFRAAMPGIFDALRLCNGWAWTYVVVAELIAANEGLGYRILKFSRFLQTPKIFVYLLVLGIIGLALDFLFRRFNARVFHWAEISKR